MSSAPVLALAEAQQRLGKPGRPRLAEQAARVVAPCSPRLLGLRAAAAYLGIAERTAREMDAAGVLRRVRIPLAAGGEMRKLLYDVQDLDRLIEVWKDPAR